MNPFYENKDDAAQAYETDNMEFPEHLHEHIEILLVLKGSISVRIMEREQELASGDCAVIFPQQIHSYHTSGENCVRLYIFDAALTGRYLHSIGKYSPAHPFLAAGELSEDAVLALDRLYALCSEGQRVSAEPRFIWESPVLLSPSDNGSREESVFRKKVPGQGGKAAGRKKHIEMTGAAGRTELCIAWMQLLFALLWFQMEPEKRERSDRTELTCQVVQYVMEHFQEPLTLEVLARELHVNKYYVSHIFSERLQVPFRRYLNHIRLEYAMQLMKSGNAPLTDIWVEAGFNSQRSFNRAFLEIMGMPPGTYRRAL